MALSSWEPPADKIHPLFQELIELDRSATQHIQKFLERNNLSREEEEAFLELQNLHFIIIKPADKGSTGVIMDKADYAWEAMRKLQDGQYYEPLTDPIYPQTQTCINTLLKQLHWDKFINQRQLRFLTDANQPRPRYFYLLQDTQGPIEVGKTVPDTER